MNTLDEDAPAHDAGGKTDVLVQVILGFFLVIAYCALAWLTMGTH
jgi:hypothetical protein